MKTRTDKGEQEAGGLKTRRYDSGERGAGGEKLRREGKSSEGEGEGGEDEIGAGYIRHVSARVICSQA